MPSSSSSSHAASAAPAPGGQAQLYPPHFDHLSLVFHTDIFILSFFLLFALFTLPRLFIRFSRKSEWSLGHILRAVPPTKPPVEWKRKFPASVIPDSVYRATMEAGSEDSHTLYSHTHLVNKSDDQRSPPPPSRSTIRRIYTIPSILSYPVLPAYSLGRVVILLGYFFTILYASIYKSSPFSSPVRVGFVAMAQLPIVFALATKNNILGAMLAIGYEKINYLHRFTGRITALAANMHVIGFFYTWAIEKTFQENITDPMHVRGLIALAGLDLLVFFSTAFWRQKCYNFFLFSHIAGFILFPLGLCLHTPTAIPWVVAGCLVYGLDHLIRLCKTRVAEATLRPIPDLGLTRVEVPRLNAGWRAGQHVRLRVISSGMGMFGWAEAHPFTIASVGGDGMLLMCKKAGDWTNKLYDLASGGNSTEKGVVMSKTAKIILEGPYGGVGHTMMDSFSGALFVAGGSGITFALAAIQDLIQKDIEGHSRVKVIELVWSVQTAASLGSMLPTFSSLIQQAPFTEIRISVYYTRASMSDDPNKLYGYLPTNITLTPGRPKIPVIMASLIDHTCILVSKPSGFMVGVCGPAGLGEQVGTAVRAIDSGRREAVGGVELCEEIFGW